MPTYRNDGKNVLIVERSDGVAVPVGPGESVATLGEITVAGFTETDAKPSATKLPDGSELVIQIPLVSNGSGVVADYQIDEDDAGFEYWREGFYLAEAWAINPATGYPTLALAHISITDELGMAIIAATDGFSVPVGETSVGEAKDFQKYRGVGSKITVHVDGAIGAAVCAFDLYIKLTKKWSMKG